MARGILSEIDAIFARTAGSSSAPKKKFKKSPKTADESIESNDLANLDTGSVIESKFKQDGQSSSIHVPQSRDPLSRKSKAKNKRSNDPEPVEVLFDPSQNILSRSNPLNDQKKRKLHLTDDELAFRDSRGTRPKTDDGLPIYTVEELKIGLGGDTPLCPFDCNCCF